MSITKSTYANRAKEITNVDEIPSEGYMVYILEADGKPIINGHGQYNRAKVIFDNKETLTSCHIKSLVARLNHIYGPQDVEYKRYIIECNSKEEANAIELFLHDEIGGNTKCFLEGVEEQLFEGVDKTSKLVINMMINSSFDGQQDLKKWFKLGIMEDDTAKVVVEKFAIGKWINGYNL